MGNPLSQTKLKTPNEAKIKTGIAEQIAEDVIHSKKKTHPSMEFMQFLFNGEVEELEPWMVQYFNALEAFSVKLYSHEMFGFLADFAKLKRDYEKKKRSRRDEQLRDDMTRIFVVYLVKSPPLELNGEITPTLQKEIRNWWNEANFDSNGRLEEIPDIKGETWTKFENGVVRFLDNNVNTDVFFMSKLYKVWSQQFGELYELWQTNREKYNAMKKTGHGMKKKIKTFKKELHDFKEEHRIPAMSKSIREDVERGLKAYAHFIASKQKQIQQEQKANAAHYQYENIIGNELYKPYDYGHNHAISHLSVPFKVRSHIMPPIGDQEAEVMLSMFAMAMILVIGVVICVLCWLWTTAFAGYYLVTKEPERRKPYRAVAGNENDVENGLFV